ncbi:two-component system response regulator YesN [Cohnella sp. SGD-V74]|uniref:response regulator n=1 Tax=unclassified Cohnella TaxID=2636738 RepID=UPI000D4449BE|nr:MULTISPECIES: response regulator [unclassified Cohnella]PRX62003.1 two-component system response regulator YesN [Cohnella sp. SGD-V74]
MNRIIIVDDEELIRESLTIQLSDLNGAVVSAALPNGSKALEWLEEHFADICLTDVRMPVVDGLQLIQEINARYPWMTNIVISSYDDFQYAKKSMLLGAVDYVLKPVDNELLKAAVDKAMDVVRKRRRYDANQMLLEKLSNHKAMLDRWLEMVLSVYLHGQPLLIVDTLGMFEGWIGERYEILNELSMAWISLLVEELKKQGIHAQVEEGEDIGLGEQSLLHSEARRYFRLCAVRRLEQAANRLMDEARKAKNLQRESAIDQVKRYIDEHYAASWGLQDLADHVAVSRSYLAKLFKEQTGMTIWTYCVSVRMSKARELLLTTSLRSYEIALQVGYGNSIHFSRIFKEYHGINPMEYKEKFGKD